MPSCCSVKSCKNYSKNTEKRIKYFTFPKDPEIVNEWVKACNKENINLKNARVCSVHFKEESFVSGTNKSKLTKFAVPTENLIADNDARFFRCKEKETVIDNYSEFKKLESKLNLCGVTITVVKCNKNDNNISKDKIPNGISESSSIPNSSDRLTTFDENYCSTTENKSDCHISELENEKSSLALKTVVNELKSKNKILETQCSVLKTINTEMNIKCNELEEENLKLRKIIIKLNKIN